MNLLTVSSIMFVLGGADGRGQAFGTVPDAGTVAMTQAGALTMASIVETRLEAVFIISTTMVGRLSETPPRWLILAGYAVGLTLLLIPVHNVLLTWAFPIWVRSPQPRARLLLLADGGLGLTPSQLLRRSNRSR